MAGKLSFKLESDETIELRVKVKKSYHDNIAIVKNFLQEINPSATVRTDKVIELAMEALMQNRDINKFMNANSSNTKVSA